MLNPGIENVTPRGKKSILPGDRNQRIPAKAPLAVLFRPFTGFLKWDVALSGLTVDRILKKHLKNVQEKFPWCICFRRNLFASSEAHPRQAEMDSPGGGGKSLDDNERRFRDGA